MEWGQGCGCTVDANVAKAQVISEEGLLTRSRMKHTTQEHQIVSVCATAQDKTWSKDLPTASGPVCPKHHNKHIP